MSVELRQLQYFVAVAEELNFSVAARRLYVTQQALSRGIQRIERDLGVRLFERTTRSVALTDAGEALLAGTRRTLAAAEDAIDAVRRVARGEPSRPLRVDISSSGLETGSLILRQLRQDRPDIAVQQVERGVEQGVVALAEGGLDALFGLATHCPPDVEAELVRREPVLLGMARDHPLVGLDAIPVAMLEGYDLLLPSDAAAGEWVEFVRSFCAQAGIVPHRWSGITYGPVAHAEVLRERLCVVPTVAWVDPPGDLVFRPLVQPVPMFAWSIITSPTAKDRPELQALQDAARALARRHGWLPDGQAEAVG